MTDDLAGKLMDQLGGVPEGAVTFAIGETNPIAGRAGAPVHCPRPQRLRAGLQHAAARGLLGQPLPGPSGGTC